MVELPNLWSEVCLRMNDANYHSPTILNSDLIKVVDSVKLRDHFRSFDASKAQDLLRLFGSISVERPTRGSGMYERGDPLHEGLVVRLLRSLEDPLHVARVLLGEIPQVKDLHLKTLTLTLSVNGIDKIDPIDPILFTGLVRLKTCSLRGLSAAQLESLLQAVIASDNIILKSLSLLGHIQSPALSEAVIKLEELKLNAGLSSECLTAMFEAIQSSFSAGKLKLKKLDLRHLSVHHVKPELLHAVLLLKQECGLDQLTMPRLSVISKKLIEVRHDRPYLWL